MWHNKTYTSKPLYIMFQIYLPIADLSVNFLGLISLGLIVGILSGMFGIGGGFLLTPCLILMGIPSPVAVASQANQIAATSLAGVLKHLQRGTVDLKMGGLVIIGGFIGSTVGVMMTGWLRSIGQLDTAIKILYVVFLGTIGVLMFLESLRILLGHKKSKRIAKHPRFEKFIKIFPFKIRFYGSKRYLSVLVPIIIGAVIAMISSLMGIGGGFMLVPALIYIVRMPTLQVIGTSLLYIMVVMLNISFLQAYNYQTMDILLSLILLVGGVFGIHIGTMISERVRSEFLRFGLALLVLSIGVNMLWGLISTPEMLYEIQF